jgi:starch synthase (maltosyl-transferring)
MSTTPDSPVGSAAATGPAAGAASEAASAQPPPAPSSDLRFGITGVTPVVECGRYPAKAVVDEYVPVTATVFREGHDAVGVTVVLVDPDGAEHSAVRMTIDNPDTQHWSAVVVPDRVGTWSFRVEAWSDPFTTLTSALQKKLDAGQGPEDLANDIEDMARVLDRGAQGVPVQFRSRVEEAAATLRHETLLLARRVAPVLSPEIQSLLTEHPVRDLVTPGETYPVWVDRRRALFSAWYEFFPRSEGAVVPPPGSPERPRSGTFRTAAERLPAVREMGFDIVYLPPIHPIGKINRKGPNNTLVVGPYDVGSPWAIGSDEGGHDAVHPDLGTIDDFDFFVARAGELGLEVALDLALQAAPDHPWVTEHPEWFTVRPDGTIAYAENPPKKYQDIYPINFDRDPQGIYHEVLRVVRYWMDHGVRIFRVDNPHTKPVNFWQWLIAEVQATDPDVIFLAEAFTKPAMMQGLGKRGFAQSYTYFTWRTAKWELEEYGRELAEQTADYMRPNFYVNTPDILHASLQYGGPPMFKIRAVLAATMVPSWGVYAGYELYEHVAVKEGSEEYLDSEKYQLRPRDWDAADRSGQTLAPYLRRLNHIRSMHPALHWLRNLRFHHADDEAVMCYSKRDPASGDTVIVVVNLDSHHTKESWLHLDMPELGMDWHQRFRVHDLFTGSDWDWGEHNFVRLDPGWEPAHILSVQPYG